MITTVKDSKRGCGWRKPGGLYFRSSGMGMPCGRMPFELSVCPCCGAGVKHKIGFQWFNARQFMLATTCLKGWDCAVCPMNNAPDKAGLVWVGICFYETPDDFLKEADRLGVSHRIHNIPKGFKLGEDWVFVAHKKAFPKACPQCATLPANDPLRASCEECGGKGKVKVAGVFHAFKPDRIEYVVKGNESKKALDEMIAKGITPVKVERIGETIEMELPPSEPKLKKSKKKSAKKKGKK